MSKRAFGELESQILFILRTGERKTVKDVHKTLGGHDNYNTVMTVMTRLAEKKQIARESMRATKNQNILQLKNKKRNKNQNFSVSQAPTSNHPIKKSKIKASRQQMRDSYNQNQKLLKNKKKQKKINEDDLMAFSSQEEKVQPISLPNELPEIKKSNPKIEEAKYIKNLQIQKLAEIKLKKEEVIKELQESDSLEPAKKLALEVRLDQIKREEDQALFFKSETEKVISEEEKKEKELLHF